MAQNNTSSHSCLFDLYILWWRKISIESPSDFYCNNESISFNLSAMNIDLTKI